MESSDAKNYQRIAGLLSCAIVVQLIYNISAVSELGEKYTEPLQLFYQIGTLACPLYMGLFQFRMSKKLSRGKKLKEGHLSTLSCLRWVAKIFILILTLASVVWIYACMPM